MRQHPIRTALAALAIFTLGWTFALYSGWSYQIDWHTTDQTNEVFQTPEGAVIAPKRVIESHFLFQTYREHDANLFGGGDSK